MHQKSFGQTKLCYSGAHRQQFKKSWLWKQLLSRKRWNYRRTENGNKISKRYEHVKHYFSEDVHYIENFTDINKSLSMQTTVLTDVRKLLLNFNSQQLAPPSTSNDDNFSKSLNKPSMTAYPTFGLENCGKRLEMSLANYTDSAPLTSTVIEDEDDGPTYDHVSYLLTCYALLLIAISNVVIFCRKLFRYLTLYCVG